MKIKSTEYTTVHNWIKRKLGKADECWIDKTHKSSVYDWANVSREYKYEMDDWIMLCKSCHSIFDKRKWTLEQLKNYVDGKKIILEKIENGQNEIPLDAFMEMAKTEGIIYSRRYSENENEVQLRAFLL